MRMLGVPQMTARARSLFKETQANVRLVKRRTRMGIMPLSSGIPTF